MRNPLLYDELASWWPVLSDPAEYEEEALVYRRVVLESARRPVKEVLELGSGGGSNASHMKARFGMTLVDRAPGMLAVSRALNPECEHVRGDMRSVRLGRTFDAVFVHDAVMYLTSEEDLFACMETARVHTRPGGVALFVPDDVRETWRPHTRKGGHDRGRRSLRYLEWGYDPDPADTWFTTLFAFLLRDGDEPPRGVFDEHRLGLFPRATWLDLLGRAGFEAFARPYRHSSFPADAGHELFLGRVVQEPA